MSRNIPSHPGARFPFQLNKRMHSDKCLEKFPPVKLRHFPFQLNKRIHSDKCLGIFPPVQARRFPFQFSTKIHSDKCVEIFPPILVRRFPFQFREKHSDKCLGIFSPYQVFYSNLEQKYIPTNVSKYSLLSRCTVFHFSKVKICMFQNI
jgi:hypothetical protein